MSEVVDEKGIPTEAHTKLETARELVLDDKAFYKLHLLFLLQKGIKEAERAELLALRINRFSREEALYWISRILHFGKTQEKWAIKGL
ncbi:hypothetical protein JQC72_15715 [Polycladomyces sp. WAk]|uniref:DUF7680 domain-containing protein n=1 Tax=Polycladomyces zharkentensis TaxID=2807616 RepID=A0ABS2WNB9_9BACL|nr:hypothetical protein [Polycladomyces sp. WAk]MBN2910941.1 hypothetical protein [Polycladomyces sp. WAk]